MNVWTASWLSAALFSSLALVSVRFFDVSQKSAVIVGTSCAIVMSCILIAEGENRDRKK